MSLVFTILWGIALLVGLITAIMSIKNWHWAQMLLMLALCLSAFGTLVLGLEVFRIHRDARRVLPALELKLANVEAENEALENGGDAAMLATIFPDPPKFDVEAEGRMPGMAVWTRRLQDIHRQRGRVWTNVTPGKVDPTTFRLPVGIGSPKPHGLEKDAIVYVFEEGEPDAAAPQQGAQYLGEFRVIEAGADGATLESVYALDNRTGNRINNSQKPWAIYETMPADSHELFVGRDEATLRKWLPAATVEEYIRQGEKVEKPNATEGYDPHVAAYDEEGHRLGPDDVEKAVKWVYDRQLRDYAYLFAAANRELVELSAERAGLTEDVKRLGVALETSKKFVALRAEEKAGLTEDLTHMEADRKAIETHLATLKRLLASVAKQITEKQAENLRMANELRDRQARALDELDRVAPAPGAEFTGVR